MKKSIPKNWFKKFSKTKKVRIMKFSPKLFSIVKDLRKKLNRLLGKSVEIEHRGSTALGISGAGEVDLYLRVKNRKEFEKALIKLKKKFGKPDSYYSDEPRARFNYAYKDIEFELMLVLCNAIDEIEGRLFFNYMKSHPALLPKYEAIKTKCAKVSRYKYQIEKNRFVCKVLHLARRAKTAI